MKYYIYTVLLLLLTASCSDDVQKWDQWPEWKLASPLSVGGQVLDEEIYSNFQGKKLHLEKGQEVEFSGIDEIESILSPDYFEYVSENKARFKGETADYSVLYDPANELLYIEKAGATYPDGLWFCGANWGHPQARLVTTSGWSMDGPNNVLYCYKSADNVFQLTLYLANNFSFKFFKHRGWGEGDNEITTLPEDNITLTTPFLVAGKTGGDFIPGPLFQPGVYLITLDLNNNTCAFEAKDENIQEQSFLVNGQEMGILEEASSFLGIALELHKGDEVTFSNFGDVRKMLQPDFFENITKDKATFIGVDGNYKLYYDPINKLTYLENRSVNYPDGLWVCGSSFGHPQAGRVTVGAWTFNLPSDAFQCVKVADNIFETTLYLVKDFQFKFYKQRPWGGELASTIVNTQPVNLLGKGWYYSDPATGGTGGGHFTGDFVAGPDFTPGVYRVRIDLNKNICMFIDKVDEGQLGPESYKINGTELTQSTNPSYIAVELNLTKGQVVDFEGFSYLDYMLQPEYFTNENGQYKFNAPDGKYRISYNKDRELIYVEKTTDTEFPETVWITGAAFGHPRISGLLPDDIGNWGWDNPKDFICCVKTGDRVYETNLLLNNDFMFRFYKRKGWNNEITSFDVTIVSEGDLIALGGYWDGDQWKETENFGPGNNFRAGIYHVKLDMNTNTCTFTKR